MATKYSSTRLTKGVKIPTIVIYISGPSGLNQTQNGETPNAATAKLLAALQKVQGVTHAHVLNTQGHYGDKGWRNIIVEVNSAGVLKRADEACLKIIG